MKKRKYFVDNSRSVKSIIHIKQNTYIFSFRFIFYVQFSLSLVGLYFTMLVCIKQLKNTYTHIYNTYTRLCKGFFYLFVCFLFLSLSLFSCFQFLLYFLSFSRSNSPFMCFVDCTDRRKTTTTIRFAFF